MKPKIMTTTRIVDSLITTLKRTSILNLTILILLIDLIVLFVRCFFLSFFPLIKIRIVFFIRKQKTKSKEEEENADFEFPDEVDVPPDQPARIRFQK